MLAAGLLALGVFVATPARAVTVDDVIAMAQAGVSVDIMLESVKGERLRLTSADVARLKAARVPEQVIAAMRGAPAAVPT